MTDPKTGLPELPKGYFYRTYEGHNWRDGWTYRMQIIKRKWYGGRELIHEKRISEPNPDAIERTGGTPYLYALTDSAVLHTSKELKTMLDAYREVTSIEKRLLGNYPPKRINNA